MSKVRLQEMAWPDIEAAVAGGKDTVIIPIGSIEQHGPHLPIVTDTLFGEALGEKVAERLGDSLVAPVISTGCSDHHLAFAGSISLPATLLQQIIEAYCASLALHGFKHIVLLPTHGGNFGPVSKVAEKLKVEYSKKNIDIISLTDLDGLINAIAEPLFAFGYSLEQIGAHAGAGETSIVMAVRPDLVHKDRFEEGYMGELDIPRLLRDGLKAVTPIGVLGDPRGSSEEMGQKILDYLVNQYVTWIQAAKTTER